MWTIFFYLIGLILAWCLGEMWIKRSQKKLSKKYIPEDDKSRRSGYGRFDK